MKLTRWVDIMTLQIVNQLALLALAAVVTLLLMVLIVLQSRYSIPAVGVAAVMLAVYAQNKFAKKHNFQLFG